jgi:hypothetical protein
MVPEDPGQPVSDIGTRRTTGVEDAPQLRTSSAYGSHPGLRPGLEHAPTGRGRLSALLASAAVPTTTRRRSSQRAAAATTSESRRRLADVPGEADPLRATLTASAACRSASRHAERRTVAGRSRTEPPFWRRSVLLGMDRSGVQSWVLCTVCRCGPAFRTDTRFCMRVRCMRAAFAAMESRLSAFVRPRPGSGPDRPVPLPLCLPRQLA